MLNGDFDLPNDLQVPRGLQPVGPSLPVVFRKRVLETDDGVLLDDVLIDVGKLLICDPFLWIAVGILEVLWELSAKQSSYTKLISDRCLDKTC